MDQASLRTLLRDALLLARYALRNGLLHADSKLFELIGALGSVPRPANETALVAQLCAEMNGLTKIIDPARFKLWVWSQALIDFVRRFVRGLPTFALGFMTLLLTLYLAFQSSQLHQADTALRAYDEWVAQQPKEKLYAAFKMFRYERVLNVKAPPLAQLDAYQKLIDDAHQLDTKGEAIKQLLQDASQLLYVPPILADVGGKLGSLVERLNTGNLIVAPGLKGPDAPTAPDCKREYLQTSLKSAKLPPLSSAGDIDAYESSWTCFLMRLGIDAGQVAYLPWATIYETRSKVNMLVTWLLPGLYGLLGACVYLMRDMMVPRDDRFSPDRGVLKKLSLLLRIALGGLAGIIIGWFWVPGSITSGTAGPPISSIPFGIAFLAGFSIETLFSLLDRLKTLDNNKSKKPA